MRFLALFFLLSIFVTPMRSMADGVGEIFLFYGKVGVSVANMGQKTYSCELEFNDDVDGRDIAMSSTSWEEIRNNSAPKGAAYFLFPKQKENKAVEIYEGFSAPKDVGAFLISKAWGKNYVEARKDGSYVFSDMYLHAKTDLNCDGMPEYWLSYKTMYGQYGGLVLERNLSVVDGFRVLVESCRNCGD